MHNVLLFVYGTLKRGHCRAHHLATSRFIGEARTAPAYRMFDCGEYPGMVEAANGVSIEGELYSVDEELLPRLDEVESASGGLYRRQRIRLEFPQVDAPVQTYLYAESVEALRDCGSRW